MATGGPVPWCWMTALTQSRAGLPTSAPLTHGPAQLTAHPCQPHHRPPRGQEDRSEGVGAPGAKHGHGPEAAVGAPLPPGQYQARFQLAWILPDLTAQDEASIRPQQRRGGPERYWGPTGRSLSVALGLKHGGAPEPHWPGPMHPPERRVRPPAFSWSGGAGTPPQRAIVGLKGSVKHPASGSLGKTWCFLRWLRSHTVCFKTVITCVVIACRIPALQTSGFRSTGSHGFLCLSRVPDKTWWVLVTLRVFAEPVNEPNGQELVLLRALNPRLASALTEGCSVTVFLLLLVLPQKASRGSQHPPPSPKSSLTPTMGTHCSNLKCNRVKRACVKLQTSGPTCSL